MRRIWRLIDLDYVTPFGAPRRLPPVFKLVMWGSLLSTVFLLCWLAAIVKSWSTYHFLPINPFMVWFLLFVALLFIILSASLVRVVHHEWHRRRYGYVNHSGLGEFLFSSCAAIYAGGLFLLIAIFMFGLIIPADALMTRTRFVYQNLYTGPNLPVRFVNPSDGNVQVLCVGTDGKCLAGEDIPDALRSPGLRLLPGQTRVIAFSSPGDYAVQSLTTPGMSMTIHVNQLDVKGYGP